MRLFTRTQWAATSEIVINVDGNCDSQCFQEEQQKLRGTIEEADEMIKSLDDCICEMEAGMVFPVAVHFMMLPYHVWFL